MRQCSRQLEKGAAELRKVGKLQDPQHDYVCPKDFLPRHEKAQVGGWTRTSDLRDQVSSSVEKAEGL